MLTVTLLSVIACIVKFFFDGVSFSIFGHMVILGHADASTFGSILTPILSAHGVREWKLNSQDSDSSEDASNEPSKVDNPDV